MSSTTPKQQYIIQIDLEKQSAARKINSSEKRGEGLDLKTIELLFEGTGIELDQSYQPICINPQLKRYVVRGQATEEERRQMEQTFGDGIKFFADSKIHPSK